MKKFDGYNRGINLGGWLSQCCHNKEHYETFISEDDIKTIASWGLDHVRVPLDYEVLETEDGTLIPEGFVYIDNCLKWCERYGLNVIIDLHKTAGYSFNDANTASNALFTNERFQQRFLNLWIELSKRYAQYSDRVAFELLNEIVEADNCEPWNKLATKAIAEIRKYSSTIKILMGGICWNSINSVHLIDIPYDENVVYNFHFYEPLLFTHQKAYWVPEMPKELVTEYPAEIKEYLENSQQLGAEKSALVLDKTLLEMGIKFIEKQFLKAVSVAEERGYALYCGEYGVIDQAPINSTLNWFSDMHEMFEKYNIGRAAWSYKKMDFGIVDDHYKPIFEKLIKLL